MHYNNTIHELFRKIKTKNNKQIEIKPRLFSFQLQLDTTQLMHHTERKKTLFQRTIKHTYDLSKLFV